MYSPSRDQLRDGGLRAWVCAHTIVRLQPGERAAYLRAVGQRLRPLLEERGLRLMGAYAVPMRSDEAIMLWAAEDFRALCRVYGTLTDDAALHAWAADVLPLERERETMWLVPSLDCFFHPQYRPPAVSPAGVTARGVPPRY